MVTARASGVTNIGYKRIGNSRYVEYLSIYSIRKKKRIFKGKA